MEHDTLWAPWRMEYLKGLEDSDKKASSGGSGEDNCFLCSYWNEPAQRDRENLLLWRGQKAMLVFNRYPYSAGHLLIAPVAHVPELESLDNDTILEMMHMTRDGQKVLSEAISPHGFNIGINIGRCAGAGLPGHIHLHLVPRWNGDTNCMTVIARARIISQSLDELYDQLWEISQKLDLPGK
ncbi:MAG: HIT domain-containing protein [Sedimentisphaerales bacterium]|nr:HIT domain-containing protein [Sedimentisphaerales bacterium]